MNAVEEMCHLIFANKVDEVYKMLDSGVREFYYKSVNSHFGAYCIYECPISEHNVLSAAVYIRNEELVSKLVELGAKPTSETLVVALQRGMLEYLMKCYTK